MGPSSYITDQNEYFCGLWVRDLGTFLKKVFITVEHDTAELIVTVKHLGQEIGRGGSKLSDLPYVYCSSSIKYTN